MLDRCRVSCQRTARKTLSQESEPLGLAGGHAWINRRSGPHCPGADLEALGLRLLCSRWEFLDNLNVPLKGLLLWPLFGGNYPVPRSIQFLMVVGWSGGRQASGALLGKPGTAASPSRGWRPGRNGASCACLGRGPNPRECTLMAIVLKLPSYGSLFSGSDDNADRYPVQEHKFRQAHTCALAA